MMEAEPLDADAVEAGLQRDSSRLVVGAHMRAGGTAPHQPWGTGGVPLRLAGGWDVPRCLAAGCSPALHLRRHVRSGVEELRKGELSFWEPLLQPASYEV
ncbi:unnamed protein product [Urochloa humidicola]